jgi:hypothetical protein
MDGLHPHHSVRGKAGTILGEASRNIIKRGDRRSGEAVYAQLWKESVYTWVVTASTFNFGPRHSKAARTQLLVEVEHCTDSTVMTS